MKCFQGRINYGMGGGRRILKHKRVTKRDIVIDWLELIDSQ